jgi:hypothetical protein
MKKNKQIFGKILVFVIVLLLFLFYWFWLRPINIDNNCKKFAIENSIIQVNSRTPFERNIDVRTAEQNELAFRLHTVCLEENKIK